MARHVLVGWVVLAVGSLVGCAGTQGMKLPSGPPITLGPEGATTPSELPPKAAAVACAATAHQFDKKDKVEEAIAQYEKARQLDPEGQKAVCRRLAVLYDKKGEFTQASAEYDRAFKLWPNDADLHNDAGYSFYSRGDWTKAEEQFAKATQLAPANKRAWMNRGLAVAMMGRTEDSLQCFRKVVSEPEARSNLGFVLAAQGQTEAAKAEYRQALALAPELGAARAALDALENPNRPVVQKAEGKREVRVPTIQELEERLKLATEEPKLNSPVPVER